MVEGIELHNVSNLRGLAVRNKNKEPKICMLLYMTFII
jgi:hypothetical protein